MDGFCEQAPAKLNLYLHITGRRNDGYHLLDSLVAFTDIGDRVTATPAQGISLSVTGPYADQVPLGSENLVFQAAQSLAEQANVPANAHLVLEKNLPVASGIGGGSADAAATLRALARLWQLKLPGQSLIHAAAFLSDDKNTRKALSTLFTVWRDDLDADMMTKIAVKLGADVPVCLESRTVYMSGIGEHLSIAPALPKVWLVLVNPNIALSTPKVFKARRGDFSDPAPVMPPFANACELAGFLKSCRNDLMAPAISIEPAIQNVLGALSQSPDCLFSRMSGSGATCFGLFATPQSAQKACQSLTQNHREWWVQDAQMCAHQMEEHWL